MHDLVNDSFNKLRIYCEKEKFSGWDPYDGLNSIVLLNSPFYRFSLVREIWIQVFKRSPFNLRRIFGVEKGYNPKGLGLFLSAYTKLYTLNRSDKILYYIKYLADKIINLKTTGYSGACWGYNFPWQSMVFYQNKYDPTVVATTFIACSLMDAYDVTHESMFLDIALSSANFVTKDLYRTKKEVGFIFSYSPKDQTVIYNASLLGSKLLSRAYSYTNNTEYIDLAHQSVMACAKAQQDNGAWFQGEEINQKWTDNFHTGYNLECIEEFQKYSGETQYSGTIEKGLKYLISNFICDDGAPKYYDKKIYPIDIHSSAQFIVTLIKLKKVEEYKILLNKVLEWTIKNMQDKNGYFYFQKNKHYDIKIPYMRWSQAWMFYCMSCYLDYYSIEWGNS